MQRENELTLEDFVKSNFSVNFEGDYDGLEGINFNK